MSISEATDTPPGPLARATAFFERQGSVFWAVFLLAVGLLIYMPRLGSYPLWDPWESHYTQVAWEMQQRLTWNNPWYRGIDNWWSKPILMLWMLRASLGIFWDHVGDFANPEWAARLPFALTAILGGILHFDWVRRLFGRKIGVIAGIALMTGPQYVLVGRQVMADMLFVVPYAASMGYLAVGLFTPRPTPSTAPDTAVGRALAWLHHNMPFVVFWVLQAFSVLAKGFVGPTLVTMVLLGYWIATFRWRDYADLVQGRPWARYLAVRIGIALAIAAPAFMFAYYLPGGAQEQRLLYQGIIGAFACLVIALGVFHDLPPFRHALRLMSRMRVKWGLALFFAIAAPWFVYMTVKHGWPYWQEFIFYHHLGRAAGTIDKPGGTFDYFVRQIAFAAFPWTAFVPVAIYKFLGRASPWRSIANRRNLYLLLATLLPYLFFTLSATKFAHYIMPVIPMLVVLLAVSIGWLGKSGEERVPLAEDGPAVGPPVEPYADHKRTWHERLGSSGDMLVIAATALIVFGILAHDLVLDFRYFLRLFLYYFNRETPFDYQPFVVLQFIFFPMGIVIGLLLFARWIGRIHLVAFSTLAVVLACYLSWVTMPAMKDTYSFKSFLGAYTELAKPGEPIAQYNDWQQPVRSVIFLFQNRCVHLRNDKQATAFLKRPGRKFIMVDKDRLADLRRVAKEADTQLYVVFDGHPYGRMVSDVANPQDTRKAAAHILSELPADVNKIDANFQDMIRLIGWQAVPPKIAPGKSAEVSLYYRCEKTMSQDWQIFIHGDGPQGGSNRLHLDHFPVEGLYPTTEWQEGEIIRDTFSVKVPHDYPFDYIELWNGWYMGNQRLKLTNNPPNDGQDRVRGPRIVIQRE